MTGRDLIIYILQHNLEDKDIFKEIGFMDEEEAAIKYGVGVATIRTSYMLGFLQGFMIDDKLYLLKLQL